MQDIIARIREEGWITHIWIDFRNKLPFMCMIDYLAVGRGKTMESAMVEAMDAMGEKGTLMTTKFRETM